MTLHSLKTIGHRNLDLECTQALKMGGRHLGNKMADINFFFQKLSPFTLNVHRKPEDDILNPFAAMRKVESEGGKKEKKGEKFFFYFS